MTFPCDFNCSLTSDFATLYIGSVIAGERDIEKS